MVPQNNSISNATDEKTALKIAVEKDGSIFFFISEIFVFFLHFFLHFSIRKRENNFFLLNN